MKYIWVTTDTPTPYGVLYSFSKENKLISPNEITNDDFAYDTWEMRVVGKEALSKIFPEINIIPSAPPLKIRYDLKFQWSGCYGIWHWIHDGEVFQLEVLPKVEREETQTLLRYFQDQMLQTMPELKLMNL